MGGQLNQVMFIDPSIYTRDIKLILIQLTPFELNLIFFL